MASRIGDKIMKNNLTYRVELLENNYRSLDKKIDDIMSNDLPHIKESVIRVDGKVDSLRGRVGILSYLQLGAIIIILSAIISKVL